MKTKLAVILSCVLLSVSGCGAEKNYYEFIFKNIGSKEKLVVGHVTWGKNNDWGCGNLGNDYPKTAIITSLIPSETTVEWKDDDKTFVKSFIIPKLPEKFDGKFLFTFNDQETPTIEIFSKDGKLLFNCRIVEHRPMNYDE